MSATGDTSHAALLRRRAGRIIAGNRNNNPINPQSSVGALDQATVTLSHIGSIKYTTRPELGPALVENPCCTSEPLR